MNAIDCFEAAENASNISLLTFKSKIIENIEVVSKLKFSKEDIYPKKEKKESEEEEENEEATQKSNEELDNEKLEDIRNELEKTLGILYDNACEVWTMYGIFICKDKQPGESMNSTTIQSMKLFRMPNAKLSAKHESRL